MTYFLTNTEARQLNRQLNILIQQLNTAALDAAISKASEPEISTQILETCELTKTEMLIVREITGGLAHLEYQDWVNPELDIQVNEYDILFLYERLDMINERILDALKLIENDHAIKLVSLVGCSRISRGLLNTIVKVTGLNVFEVHERLASTV